MILKGCRKIKTRPGRDAVDQLPLFGMRKGMDDDFKRTYKQLSYDGRYITVLEYRCCRIYYCNCESCGKAKLTRCRQVVRQLWYNQPDSETDETYEVDYLLLDVLRCPRCRRTHRVLPPDVAPYKRYCIGDICDAAKEPMENTYEGMLPHRWNLILWMLAVLICAAKEIAGAVCGEKQMLEDIIRKGIDSIVNRDGWTGVRSIRHELKKDAIIRPSLEGRWPIWNLESTLRHMKGTIFGSMPMSERCPG